jgi:hypothetical protein
MYEDAILWVASISSDMQWQRASGPAVEGIWG